MSYQTAVTVMILSCVVGFFSAISPESLQGVTMGGLWAWLLITCLRHIKRRAVESWMVSIILSGLFARFAMGFVHLAVGFWFYKGQLDFPGYHLTAIDVGRALLRGRIEETGGIGIGTQVVQHLLGLFYLMSGPGIVGMILLSGLIGFLGSYLFLRAYEIEFTYKYRRDRRFLALGLFLLPSLTYWAILLGKDSWMFVFLGWASYAFVNLLRGFRFRYLVGLVAALLGVTLIRLPVGGVLVVAVGFAWILRRGQNSPAALIRPLRFAGLALVSSGLAVSVLSLYLGEYADLRTRLSLFEGALQLGLNKHVGLSTDPTAGGSSLPIGITGFGAGAVLGYLPFGMFTFLFRPLIFEAHHALALGAALESTFFLVLVFWRRRNLYASIGSIFTRPFVSFCTVTFLLLTGMLSLETNFGVIVRHRTMVLPFLLILLAVPRSSKRNLGRSQIGAIQT